MVPSSPSKPPIEEVAPPGLPTFGRICALLEERVPGLKVELIENPARPEQSSLLLPYEHALEAARVLRDDPEFALDFCSNVSGVDWLDREEEYWEETTVFVKGPTGPMERQVKRKKKRKRPGYLEVVYHLYSMRHGRGPLIVRQRTQNRVDQVRVVSFTPIWRSAEFQEREVYDLFGVRFDGHPDLRRILMWDEFEDYPMRKDYVEPKDV